MSSVPQSREGFTLIELLIGLAILALLAGITVGPALASGMASLRLESFMREFATALRELRSRAVFEARDMEIVLYADKYCVKYADHHKVLEVVRWPSGVQIDPGSIGKVITFADSGVYKWTNNDTIRFIGAGGQVRQVIFSSGGRMTIR
jgi:prepilin-type N-terminal cleavage/methylation domain-containing protein